MWIAGEHCQKVEKSLLDELSEVKGDLDDEQAKVWFARFCRANFSFTIKLLTGKDLDLHQELKLRALFLRDFCVNVEGRGVGKSFTICFYIILYALFNPGSKIGICSGTFRQSKLIFKQIEKFADDPAGKFLKQCMSHVKHDPDGWEMRIGTSTIEALPLTEKIRGKRFHKVIIDEYLLVPQEMVSLVIRPFLTAKRELTPIEAKIKKMEDKLIAEGKMREDQRQKTPSNSIIGLSSACYKFEDLYKNVYLDYCKRIGDDKAEDVNHLVWKLSYEAVEGFGRLDLKLINEAREQSSRAQFDREYRAIFTDESGGFFNYQTILDATIPTDHAPMLKIKGAPNKKYILAIDPNYSESQTADNFAMSVIELDEENKSGVLVHCYAIASSKISKRAKYLEYLLDNFNIVYIIVDNAGGPKFISDAEQFLGGFKKNILEFPDTFADGDEGLRLAKRNYNPGAGKILHSQVFSKNNWIRDPNEALQYHLEHKKILIGGRMGDKGTEFARGLDIPIEDIEFTTSEDYSNYNRDGKMVDFIDHINEIVNVAVKELTLIEAKSSATGHMSFDLPSNLKDPKNPKRARRDLYTTLILASWGMKCYYDIHSDKAPTETFFKPFFL